MPGKPGAPVRKGVRRLPLNGKSMKASLFQQGGLAAYDRLIPVGEQVPYFLLEVVKKAIDVETSSLPRPKSSLDEQLYWRFFSAAVKESIGMFNDVPT